MRPRGKPSHVLAHAVAIGNVAKFAFPSGFRGGILRGVSAIRLDGVGGMISSSEHQRDC
jgi:hypothetical protein